MYSHLGSYHVNRLSVTMCLSTTGLLSSMGHQHHHICMRVFINHFLNLMKGIFEVTLRIAKPSARPINILLLIHLLKSRMAMSCCFP